MPRHSDKPRNFKCPKCDKSYVQKCHLKVHMDRKHSENPPEPPPKENLPCTHECGMVFSSQKDLKRHVKIRHDESKPIVCSLCNCRFTKKRAMRQHCARVHKDILQKDPELKEKIYSETCDICGKTFTSHSKLKRHITSKHTEKAHECEECDVKFALDRDLRAHIRTVHHKKRTCEYCHQEIQGTYKSFSAHKKECIKTNGPDHKCHYPGCFASFKKKYNLKVHLNTVHNERSIDYECQLCRKKFGLKKVVQIHLQNVHKVTKVSLDNFFKEVEFKPEASNEEDEEAAIDATNELDEVIESEVNSESNTHTEHQTSSNDSKEVPLRVVNMPNLFSNQEHSSSANDDLFHNDLMIPTRTSDGFESGHNNGEIFSSRVPTPEMPSSETGNPFVTPTGGESRRRKRKRSEGTPSEQNDIDRDILELINTGECSLDDVHESVPRNKRAKRGTYLGSTLDRLFGTTEGL